MLGWHLRLRTIVCCIYLCHCQRRNAPISTNASLLTRRRLFAWHELIPRIQYRCDESVLRFEDDAVVLQTIAPLLRKYSLIVLAPCIAFSAWSAYERDRFYARILPLLHDSPQMFAKEIAAAQEHTHGVRRSIGAEFVNSIRTIFGINRKADA